MSSKAPSSPPSSPIDPLSHLPFTYYLVLSFLLAVVTISLPQHTLLRRASLLLQISIVAQGFLTSTPPPNTPAAAINVFGLLFGTLTARYLDRLYLHTPEDKFHRIKADGTKDDARQLSPWEKALWAAELLGTTRGIGWDWEVSGIPRPKRQSRLGFVCGQLVRFVGMFAALYLVGLTARNIQSGFPSVAPPALREGLVDTAATPLFLYLFVAVGYAVTIYAHLGYITLPLSMLCVGLRVGPRAWQEPEAWPPNFGSLGDAYTLRRFWGLTWHQQFRRIVGTPPSMLLTSCAPKALLDSKSHSARLFRRYFLLLGSFLVSGLVHAAGPYMVTRTQGLPISIGREIFYFLMQGVAMMVEDLFCWIIGIHDSMTEQPTATRRWLGYLVTGAWYVWSRAALKAAPLAHAHGIRSDQGPLIAAVEMIGNGADAVPGNFVAKALGGVVVDDTNIARYLGGVHRHIDMLPLLYAFGFRSR